MSSTHVCMPAGKDRCLLDESRWQWRINLCHIAYCPMALILGSCLCRAPAGTQSILTGESGSVAKFVDAVSTRKAVYQDKTCLLFSACLPNVVQFPSCSPFEMVIQASNNTDARYSRDRTASFCVCLMMRDQLAHAFAQWFTSELLHVKCGPGAHAMAFSSIRLCVRGP